MEDWGDLDVELVEVRDEGDVVEEEGSSHTPLSERAHQVGVVPLK